MPFDAVCAFTANIVPWQYGIFQNKKKADLNKKKF